MNGFFFGNPAGVWGLLAVPAILVVHFLQERTRVFPVSTLFLLGTVDPATPRGVVLRRLRSSWTLWLQVVAALLLSWVLCEPRWVHQGAWRRMTLVVDDSASMEPFRERVLSGLEAGFRLLARGPVYTEWTVIAASRPQDPLYRGSNWDAALAAVRSVDFVQSEGDLHRLLTTAVLARGNVAGEVFWITDRQREGLPPGVMTLAYGEPLANCGWAGLRVWREGDTTLWEAIVRNWSDAEQQRDWFWSDEAGETAKKTIQLAAGGIATLRGAFPQNFMRGRLNLSADAFARDDALDLVAPLPRPLRVGCSLAGEGALSWARRIAATVPGAEVVKEGEVRVLVAPANDASLHRSGPMVLFAEREFPPPPGAAVGEDHPLGAGLDWQGLLLGAVGDLNPDPGDAVLVWRGAKPLVWLGNANGSPRLWFNFPWSRSNADRVPAMVLLMGRFLSRVQSVGEEPCRDNAAAGETLPLVPGSGWKILLENGMETDLSPRISPRAPRATGFFQVVNADRKTVFSGASQFLDPRESDFSAAGRCGAIGDLGAQMDRQQTQPDRFTELWLLLAGMAMLGAWVNSTRGALRGTVGGGDGLPGGAGGAGMKAVFGGPGERKGGVRAV